jgi:large subunit ribosomal protein L28
MAKCQNCNRGPQFGNNRPWSKKATRRDWKVNVQKVTVMENGRTVTKHLCTSCLRTAMKTA